MVDKCPISQSIERTDLQEGDIVLVNTSDSTDEWFCPVCGHPNYNEHFDIDYCENCSSYFKETYAVEITTLREIPKVEVFRK